MITGLCIPGTDWIWTYNLQLAASTLVSDEVILVTSSEG